MPSLLSFKANALNASMVITWIRRSIWKPLTIKGLCGRVLFCAFKVKTTANNMVNITIPFLNILVWISGGLSNFTIPKIVKKDGVMLMFKYCDKTPYKGW
jgi:hypothetical protein